MQDSLQSRNGKLELKLRAPSHVGERELWGRRAELAPSFSLARLEGNRCYTYIHTTRMLNDFFLQVKEPGG